MLSLTAVNFELVLFVLHLNWPSLTSKKDRHSLQTIEIRQFTNKLHHRPGVYISDRFGVSLKQSRFLVCSNEFLYLNEIHLEAVKTFKGR